VEVRSLAESLV